jgi:ubiquinone/menaquinone biosynthesis C-methylase UbiE
MKIRDSGMPDELHWGSFFDANRCLDALDFPAAITAASAFDYVNDAACDSTMDVVDFGCGYGLFAVAAAARKRGTVYAIDLEPEMIAATARKANSLGLTNLRTVMRDFAAAGTGLPDGSVAYAMLFNILHADRPLPLLQEAYRVLKPKGKVAVMHWIHDASTPRGPHLSIRPRPEQFDAWLTQSGFEITKPFVPLPPYHFGTVGTR